jgi:hypothetical protein
MNFRIGDVAAMFVASHTRLAGSAVKKPNPKLAPIGKLAPLRPQPATIDI